VLPVGRRAPFVDRARLAAEIVVTYGRARIHLRRSDLPAALAQLRADAGPERLAGDEARVLALRFAHAARRTLGLIPADSRCLMRSLVLTALLARRGIRTTLVVAVRVSGGFGAHAWVEIDGRPLLEPAHPPFQRLVEL
jgi:hypothetical protein